MKTVLFDLDNTVWDWVDCWYRAYWPYINRVSELTGITLDDLIAKTKATHIAQGNTLNPVHPSAFCEIHNPLLYDAYSEYNDALLRARLYPDMLEVLMTLREAGIRVEFLTGNCRAHDYLTMTRTSRLFNGGEIVKTKTHNVFKRHAKPCMMVGDSCYTDLIGASEAGCVTVHALWGKPNPDQDALLRRVTSWSDEQVEKHYNHKFQPDYALTDIKEILNICQIQTNN